MSDNELFRNVIRAEFGHQFAARRRGTERRGWKASDGAATKLREAIREFNEAEREQLIEETGLTWLGDTGPIFQAGPVLIRGLFVDPAGVHWCDADLVVESAYNSQPGALDYWQDRIGGDLDPVHELLVWATWRGRHTAFITPVVEVADLLELNPPVPSLKQWARCWESIPSVSDRSEQELLALGHAVPGLTPPL